MSKVRVCFLGTPEFAVTSLQALLDDDHFEVVGVVTQPDRPAGRKLVLTPSPVKLLAQAHNLKVLSPEALKDNKLINDAIKTWGAEVAVVVAFGQILTEEFMSSFNFGAVNVHGSLLPRWRGAAPIQRSIQYGDQETGVALQRMVKKLDAGDVIGIRKISIPLEMSAMELHDQLALLGADLLRVELMDYIRGNLAPERQDESLVTIAKKIDKMESEIKWNLHAIEVHNQVRALTMGPGSYTNFNGKKLKIHKTMIPSEFAKFHFKVETQTELKSYLENYQKRKTETLEKAGEVIQVTEEFIRVQTGNGYIDLLEVQPESRNRMKIKDFLKGNEIKSGQKFN